MWWTVRYIFMYYFFCFCGCVVFQLRVNEDADTDARLFLGGNNIIPRYINILILNISVDAPRFSTNIEQADYMPLHWFVIIHVPTGLWHLFSKETGKKEKGCFWSGGEQGRKIIIMYAGLCPDFPIRMIRRCRIRFVFMDILGDLRTIIFRRPLFSSLRGISVKRAAGERSNHFIASFLGCNDPFLPPELNIAEETMLLFMANESRMVCGIWREKEPTCMPVCASSFCPCLDSDCRYGRPRIQGWGIWQNNDRTCGLSSYWMLLTMRVSHVCMY